MTEGVRPDHDSGDPSGDDDAPPTWPVNPEDLEAHEAREAREAPGARETTEGSGIGDSDADPRRGA